MYSKNDFSEKVFNLEWYEKYSKEWLNSYLTINQRKKITPYIHMLIYHIPELAIKFKKLNLYSTQALEKLNA